ncbi:MAG: TIGR01777 family oxidoreductase [Labilithrix sp.]|nr:TIGR01777 family oxidoreductase [Labilithrix sp.]
MRVVVSGGTGFIGRALVASLTERGDDVAVLSRGKIGGHLGPRPGCCRGAGKVELASWTPELEGEWTRVVDGADAVIHLAGAGIFDERWTAQRKEILRSSRIRSTELLAGAIARAKKKPRVFVSGSAVGYYGTSTGDRELVEDEPAGKDFLATLTRDWEAAASAAREAGVRVAHPRIGLVLGRGGGMLAKLVPVFRAYVGGPVGSGAQYMPWIHLADTVRAIEHAVDGTLEGAFNVTAPDPVTNEAFSRALGRALGRPAIMRVPEAAVKLAFGAGAEVVLTGQRAVPQKLSRAGFDFVFPELASALADLVA